MLLVTSISLVQIWVLVFYSQELVAVVMALSVEQVPSSYSDILTASAVNNNNNNAADRRAILTHFSSCFARRTEKIKIFSVNCREYVRSFFGESPLIWLVRVLRRVFSALGQLYTRIFNHNNTPQAIPFQNHCGGDVLMAGVTWVRKPADTVFL